MLFYPSKMWCICLINFFWWPFFFNFPFERYCPHKNKELYNRIQRTLSHLSTHFAWNSWEQGRTRSSCLASKSHMQTTQEVWSDSERTASLLNLYTGSWSMSFLVSPFCLASPSRSAKDSSAWRFSKEISTVKLITSWIIYSRDYGVQCIMTNESAGFTS